MKKEDFEGILFSEQVEFKKKDVEYKGTGEVRHVLIEFNRAPFDILIAKMKDKISDVQTEGKPDKLFIRYQDTGDSWELGYIKMNLKYWKYIEDIFYNYKPKFYLIREEKLEVLEKGDLLKDEKFFGGDLDVYIE